MLSTYARRVAEIEARGNDNDAWVYPPIADIDYCDDDDAPSLSPDPESMMAMDGDADSSIRFRITFMKRRYLIREGVLLRRKYMDANGCTWYNGPPDENVQIVFETINRSEALVLITTKPAKAQLVYRRATLSLRFGTPRVRLDYGDGLLTVDAWVDPRLYARQSRLNRAFLARLLSPPPPPPPQEVDENETETEEDKEEEKDDDGASSSSSWEI